MSFILDALKKSETDRQRQTGPALFEVKVAPPKAGFPVWAIAIVALLVINMVIVGWLLLRRSSKTEETAAQNTPPPAVSQPAPTSAPANFAPGPAQYNSTSPQQGYSPQGSAQQGYGPQSAQQDVPPTGGMSRGSANVQRGGQDEQSAAGGMAERDLNEPTLGAAGRTVGPGANGGVGSNPGDSGGAPAGGNPDDYAPAQDAGSPIFKGHVKRGTESGLMLYQDVATTNGANLPELRLDMHVYDSKPQARFALINMQKVTEGQMIKGEVKVEAITPDGVVLSHNGTKFLLPRD
jgi:general secretion pathway protein B